MNNIINAVFNDFIEHWMFFFGIKDRAWAISRLNNGCCYQAAHLVGNVLKANYGYTDVKLQSHCLHAWLVVDGVCYDTMYPDGYPQDVVKEWLLDEAAYNTYCMEPDEFSMECNEGYMQLHLPHAVYMIKAWYIRHGMSAPNFTKEALIKHRRESTHTERYQLRNAKRHFKKSLLTPFDVNKQCVDLGVKPMTHYFHGEFEETTTRKLLPLIRMHSVKRMKSLLRDLHNKGIPLTRL